MKKDLRTETIRIATDETLTTNAEIIITTDAKTKCPHSSLKVAPNFLEK